MMAPDSNLKFLIRNESTAERLTMKSSVYIETTIISYLTAWRSPQLIMAAHQEATRSWWDDERRHFDLFVSEAVIQEASAGDSRPAGLLE